MIKKFLTFFKILLFCFGLFYLIIDYLPSLKFFNFLPFLLKNNYLIESVITLIDNLKKFFGISFLWYFFALLLSRKGKFWNNLLFYCLIPVNFSNLAGILWFGDLKLLYYYFGSFALISNEIFSNVFLSFIVIFISLFSLYFILQSYKFINFTINLYKFFLKIITMPFWINKFIRKFNTFNKLKKTFDKLIKNLYAYISIFGFAKKRVASNKLRLITEFFLNFKHKNNNFKNKTSLEIKPIKKILDPKENTIKNDIVFDNKSLQDLLNVFNSINKFKKKP